MQTQRVSNKQKQKKGKLFSMFPENVWFYFNWK